MEKFEFELEPVKVKRKSSVRERKPTVNNLIKTEVIYNSTKDYTKTFYVRVRGKKYYIQNLLNLYKNATMIYSTPDNDKYPFWTIKYREPHKTRHYDVALLYWSPLKEGLIVKGYIEDNKFIITHLKGQRV